MKRSKPALETAIQPRSGAEDAVVNRVENLELERETMEAREAKRAEFEGTKLDWRNKVAAAADTLRAQKDADFFGGEAETYEAPVTQTEDTSEVEEVEIVDAPEDEPDYGSAKITKIVNGKSITRTVDEWIALANKVEDADAYYAAAARKQVEAAKPVPKVQDIRELAQKIQLGSEDEATDALTEVMNAAVQRVQQEKSAADTQAAGRAIYQAFMNEFSDITSDPVLNGALNDMDAQNIERFFDADPVINFDKRLRFCGEAIRTWRDGVAEKTVKTEKRNVLIGKKAQIVNLNTASQKQSNNTDKPLSEKEAKTAAVQSMFASRKKKPF
jgi:hypothetical protein